MEQLITWLSALVGFMIMVFGVFAKFQTKKHCGECRKDISNRIKSVEDNVKENEKMLAGINNNVLKILEKISTFTDTFCAVKKSIEESDKEIDGMQKSITELQTIEKFRNGSYIKD